MTFRLCLSAIVVCALWGSASRGLAQCANCAAPGENYFGPNSNGQVVIGPDGSETWVPGGANCGRCGHYSEQDYMSKSCNDCLFNWGEQYSEINALSPRFLPTWTASADAIFLGRDVLGNVTYAKKGNGGPSVLDTDFGFPIEFAAGVRGKVSRGFGDAFRVEGVYLGQTDWSQIATVRDLTPNVLGGLGTLSTPFTGFGNPVQLGGLDYNNFAQIGYTSELESFELNLLHRSGFACNAIETAFICGIRYLKLDETFDYTLYGNSPAPLGALNRFDTTTNNSLIGGQLGVLGGYKVTERIFLDFELKAAMCQNTANQETQYRNLNTLGVGSPINLSRTSAGDGSLAFIGDLNLVANFQLTNAITLRLGYYAMWIDGVALAQENVSDNYANVTLGPGYLNDNGNVVYHGPHAGFTWNW